mmetsp:Transcript_25118/g.44023  ORF Transcript_25118/g.44023 Transcript_25118/m.44023 type:complete len:188 (+) Transcript_25118:217-780(+)
MQEMAITSRAPSLFAMKNHSSIYHEGFLYLVGGDKVIYSEKLNLTSEEWELFPKLPEEAENCSLVVSEGKLIAMGGIKEFQFVHFIQMCDLKSFSWTVLNLALPNVAWLPVCFKAEDKENTVYFIMMSTLYAFTPNSSMIQSIGKLPKPISSLHGPCLFSKGVLFTSSLQFNHRSYDLRSSGIFRSD